MTAIGTQEEQQINKKIVSNIVAMPSTAEKHLATVDKRVGSMSGSHTDSDNDNYLLVFLTKQYFVKTFI